MSQNYKWSLDPIAEIPDNISKRSSHTLNQINGKIYVFGGEHVPRTPINSNLLIFDLAQKKWSEIQTEQAPSPRIGHSSCDSENTLYIFGGRTGVEMEESSLNDLYSYDEKSNVWTVLSPNEESNDLPEKRSYHAMTALKNKLYIFGGCSSNGRLNDFYEFDLDSNKWSVLPIDSEIVARGGSKLCSYESFDETVESSCLYLIGGFCGHELDDCYRYDISKRTWSKIENLPRKLSVFACSSIRNNSNVRLILHGGEVDPSTMGHNGAGEFSSDTYVFDGNNWKFLSLDEKPSQRGWHSGCSDHINRKFYIFGGSLEDNFRSNELWCLSF